MKQCFVLLSAVLSVVSAVVAGEMRCDPVGVFDSGIGGLSVLERILTLDEFDNSTGEMKPDGRPDFENERFVYFGDQANMPYGRYDAEGKTDFLRELIVRDAKFVLGEEGHRPSKIVVIACNTATAYGLDRVRAMPRPRGEKVIGVVEAGVSAALDSLKNEKDPYAIAVMATPGTISSGVYERTIRARLAGCTNAYEVVNRGGIGLADAVESGDPNAPLCARTNLVAMVDEYRSRGGRLPIKAMILGCTHYPYVLDEFRATFADLRRNPEYASLIAEDLRFIDPAVYTAIECYRSLRNDGLLRPASECVRRADMFISVGKTGPLPDSVKYGRPCGLEDIGTRIVPVAEASLRKETKEGVRKSFPACYSAIEF